MSPQIIELLFFAGIAFLIINKLLSILGTTSEDDGKSQSFFGENSTLKDVTSSYKDFANQTASIIPEHIEGYDEVILKDNYDATAQEIEKLKARISGFNPIKFVRNAKSAFELVLTSLNNGETLEQLVDKRFLEQFSLSHSVRYGTIIQDISKLDTRISEIYMFGNNAFIKVRFIGKNVTSKITNLQEEWTFFKNVTNNKPNWYLSNIEQI